MHNSNASLAVGKDKPIQKVLAALEAAGCNPQPTQDGQWMALCPAHDDHKPSLSIGEGDYGRALIHCFAGCLNKDVVAALALKLADLYPPASRRGVPKRLRQGPKPAPTPEAAVADLIRKWGQPSVRYPYRDARGKLVAVVFRWNVDGEKQIRPVRRARGGWLPGMPEEPRPLYRLPEVLEADVVHVVEGEKCADALAALGRVATTSIGGSNAARKSDWEPLRGKRVVIWPDNDEAGRAYGQVVARLCHDAGAAEVRIANLAAVWPGCPEKGDVADLLAKDKTKGKRYTLKLLKRAAAEAPPWEGPQPGEAESAAPPWRPFPVDVLPEPFRGFVQQVAESNDGCDPSYVAVPLLTLIAGCIGNRREVEIKADRREPAVIWSVVIGSSGTAKSPALKAVAQLLDPIEQEWHKQYRQALARWQQSQGSSRKSR